MDLVFEFGKNIFWYWVAFGVGSSFLWMVLMVFILKPDKANEMLHEMPTFPPWHKYTGPSNRSSDYSADPVSYLDFVSKYHDQNVVTEVFIGAKDSTKKQNLQNVIADIKFILWYFLAMTFVIPFVVNIVMCKKNILVRIFYGAGNTLADLVVMTIGSFGFIFNIAINFYYFLKKKE